MLVCEQAHFDELHIHQIFFTADKYLVFHKEIRHKIKLDLCEKSIVT